jgi:membrane protease YdiL (CAAX protease family)
MLLAVYGVADALAWNKGKGIREELKKFRQAGNRSNLLSFCEAIVLAAMLAYGFSKIGGNPWLSQGLFVAIPLVLFEEVFFRIHARNALGELGSVFAYAALLGFLGASGFASYLLNSIGAFAIALASTRLLKTSAFHSMAFRELMLGFSFLASPTISTDAILLALPFCLLLRSNDVKGAVKNLGLGNKIEFWKTCARTAFVFFALFAMAWAQTTALSNWGIDDSVKVAEKVSEMPFHYVLLAVTLAPVAEEVFFRGFLQKKAGVLASSVFFAVFHSGYGSVSEIAFAFVSAIFLGKAFEKWNDLLPIIGAHLLFNAAMLLLNLGS